MNEGEGPDEWVEKDEISGRVQGSGIEGFEKKIQEPSPSIRFLHAAPCSLLHLQGCKSNNSYVSEALEH